MQTSTKTAKKAVAKKKPNSTKAVPSRYGVAKHAKQDIKDTKDLQKVVFRAKADKEILESENNYLKERLVRAERISQYSAGATILIALLSLFVWIFE